MNISDDVLMTTTLQKGESIKVDFIKSGGWEDYDPNAEFYEKFYAEQDLILPIGKYKIGASFSCSFDSNEVRGSKYTTSVSKDIKVVE